VTVEVQHVEQVVEDLYAAGTRPSRIADSQPLLQACEARLLSIERDYLPVDHEVAPALRSQRVDELRVGPVQLLAVARQQTQIVAFAERQAANAVELTFEDPRGVGERDLRRLREAADRNIRTERKRLKCDVKRLAALVPEEDLARLATALVRAGLADDFDELRAAAVR
jgi:hypothetical protein